MLEFWDRFCSKSVSHFSLRMLPTLFILSVSLLLLLLLSQERVFPTLSFHTALKARNLYLNCCPACFKVYERVTLSGSH